MTYIEQQSWSRLRGWLGALAFKSDGVSNRWTRRVARSARAHSVEQAAHRRKGTIALVGAGPGARDLLTLRAAARIGAADVIFYDRLVSEELLELASPDARCVFVGKEVGAHAWPQDRINAAIVEEARKGLKVVRLKSGDPGIFGRAGEELEAARSAGIATEIVPGVTAVSAAGASLGRSLTERGIADTLVLTTGTGSAQAPLPDCTRFAGPGTTTAFYMSARQAGRISAALMQRGLSGQARVEVAVDVSKPAQRLLCTTVETLEDTLRDQKVTGCAILLLTWPVGGGGATPTTAEAQASAALSEA